MNPETRKQFEKWWKLTLPNTIPDEIAWLCWFEGGRQQEQRDATALEKAREKKEIVERLAISENKLRLELQSLLPEQTKEGNKP